MRVHDDEVHPEPPTATLSRTMSELVNCGLARRLAAIFYDTIVLIAIVMAATVPVVLLAGGAIEQSLVFRTAMRIYELLIGFAFFGGFWRFGGQTIGMRAWRIRVVRTDGGPCHWRDAALRYLVAILSWAVLGLGFLWSLIDGERRTWHDIASDTRLIRTS